MTTHDHDLLDSTWAPLRLHTPSRIGLGAVGLSQPLRHVLAFKADHAAARDAVHVPLDVEAVAAALRGTGLAPAQHICSRAKTREEFLRRPDLGRLPEDMSALRKCGADVGIVIADGLSARAVQRHAVPLIDALLAQFGGRYSIAAPVIATEARVALGDHIGHALGVMTVLVLIGERPGLSVADSLGIYLTHRPQPGRADAERNCISNIHLSGGLGFAQAAAVCAALVRGARQLGRSGVDLKDTSRPAQLGGETLEFRTP